MLVNTNRIELISFLISISAIVRIVLWRKKSFEIVYPLFIINYIRLENDFLSKLYSLLFVLQSFLTASSWTWACWWNTQGLNTQAWLSTSARRDCQFPDPSCQEAEWVCQAWCSWCSAGHASVCHQEELWASPLYSSCREWRMCSKFRGPGISTVISGL